VALAEVISCEYLALVPVPLFVALRGSSWLFVALGGATVITGGYALAAAILRHLLPEAVNLYRAQDVALLLTVDSGRVCRRRAGLRCSVCGRRYCRLDRLHRGREYWIGDAIGIAVFTPLLLLCANRFSRRWWKVRSSR
jgi:integral membrane sensor domain MASE1